jgi:hypothetical protein
MLFRSVFNKNSLSVLNQMNFLAKNYRPKCDICSNLCGMDWYIQNNGDLIHKDDPLSSVKDSILICEECFESGNYPKGITKEDFEMANFFNIVNPSESNFFKFNKFFL